MSAPSQVGNTMVSTPAGLGMRRAVDYLTCLKAREGHWCAAELTADPRSESDTSSSSSCIRQMDGMWETGKRDP